jgi:hypothetical protein
LTAAIAYKGNTEKRSLDLNLVTKVIFVVTILALALLATQLRG